MADIAMERKPIPSVQAIPTGALLTRIGPGAMLPKVLRELGVEPQAVFDAAGVDMARFADPESMISREDIARVILASVRASGRRDLGLLVAAQADERASGLFGQVVRSSGDLRSALHAMIRYGQLNTRGIVATLTVAESTATLEMAVEGPYGGAAAISEDTLVGRYFLIIRSLLGGGWRPTAVMLSHAPPPGTVSFSRFFGAPVHFNALRTALEFPAADLDRPSVGGAAERRAELESAAEIAAAAFPIGFEERVRGMIHGHLADPELSVEQIAVLSGMSRRSLNRRLAERGTTFARLLRSVRFDIARRLLVESETPLSDVAAAIGYGDPSVFSAAFRAWSGISPREWRKQYGRD
jgi:AraC-like DNA-binding protein